MNSNFCFQCQSFCIFPGISKIRGNKARVNLIALQLNDTSVPSIKHIIHVDTLGSKWTENIEQLNNEHTVPLRVANNTAQRTTWHNWISSLVLQTHLAQLNAHNRRRCHQSAKDTPTKWFTKGQNKLFYFELNGALFALIKFSFPTFYCGRGFLR